MKSYLILFLSVILFTSCSENEVICNYQTENDIIEYIESKDLTATKTDSGLYYTVNNEGTGKTPTENSIVEIKYKAYFLDGTQYGESESSTLNLSTLILGLSEGIQLFNEGGSGTLIIPSELAFGEAGNSTGSIPCGTVLIFEIEVIAVYDNYEEQNEAVILKYIEDNDLTATKTESGLYYVVNNEGTGTQPTSTSNVTVAYKGTFLNGTVFDESTVSGATFNLNGVIEGWTEGLQLFKEGGDGILLIPYTLGYGENGYSSIPGYTPLVFDVKLISVND